MRRLTLLLPFLQSATNILALHANKLRRETLLESASFCHLGMEEERGNSAAHNTPTREQTHLLHRKSNVMREPSEKQQELESQNVKKKFVKAAQVEMQQHLLALQSHFCNVLDDRRVTYRDDVILTRLEPERVALANLLLRLPIAMSSATPPLISEIQNYSQSYEQQQRQRQPLSRKLLNEIKAAWLQHEELCTVFTSSTENVNGDAAIESESSNLHRSKQNEASKQHKKSALQQTYTLILSSALITCDADIRIVLSDMEEYNSVEGWMITSEMYSAILVSLLSCCCCTSDNPVFESKGNNNNTESARCVNRAEVGDLAGYYFGHVTRMMKKYYTEIHYASVRESKNVHDKGYGKESKHISQAYMQHKEEMDHMWSALFIICAVCQVAPSLMDLWWRQFIEENSSATSTLTSTPTFVSCSDVNRIDDNDDKAGDNNNKSNNDMKSNRTKETLPFHAVHAALSWAAAQRDVERALTFFNTAKIHGMKAPIGAWNQHRTDTCEKSISSDHITIAPHSLLTYSSDHMVQSFQLRLLAKLAATGKNLEMDGGLREIAVQDIQRLISPETLHSAPWTVINDVLSSLSLPSAMQLIKFRTVEPDKVHLPHEQNNNINTFKSETSDVPFYIWASLLRRCAREHHIDEAEVLFTFIRKHSSQDAQTKRELVEIMMRMYATLPVPDYTSAMQLFVSHVVHHPEHEPVIHPDLTLYQLLLRAADSRNACMMSFLEGCADGVGFDHTTFELLLNSNPFKTMAHLTQKLPSDYPASSLDAQLRLPANVDAHLRREEALRARNKPLYDSTGDVG